MFVRICRGSLHIVVTVHYSLNDSLLRDTLMSEHNAFVMIVDDDAPFRSSIADYFRQHDFRVLEAASGEEALQVAQNGHIDVAIIDWLMPGINGLTLAATLRSLAPNLPIVMLTGRSDLDSQLEGFMYGIDDYWVKPFPLSLSIAKVQALLRRKESEVPTDELITLGTAVIDMRRRTITKNGQVHHMKDKEYGILRVLVAEQGAPVRRQSILARVWGYETLPITRTVDNYIVELRRKIEDDPRNPRYITTVSGLGYRLVREAPIVSSHEQELSPREEAKTVKPRRGVRV